MQHPTQEARPPARSKVTRFRVYVSQVNQTYVDVTAATPEDAAEKGYRKWRRDEAHSHVLSIEAR